MVGTRVGKSNLLSTHTQKAATKKWRKSYTIQKREKKISLIRNTQYDVKDSRFNIVHFWISDYVLKHMKIKPTRYLIK